MKVSALALLKMAMHCRSGGNIEVMGMMMVGSPAPPGRVGVSPRSRRSARCLLKRALRPQRSPDPRSYHLQCTPTSAGVE